MPRFTFLSKQAASVSNLPHKHHWVYVLIKTLEFSTDSSSCSVLDTGAADMAGCESFISLMFHAVSPGNSRLTLRLGRFWRVWQDVSQILNTCQSNTSSLCWYVRSKFLTSQQNQHHWTGAIKIAQAKEHNCTETHPTEIYTQIKFCTFLVFRKISYLKARLGKLI